MSNYPYPKMPVPEFGTPPKNTPEYPKMPAPKLPEGGVDGSEYPKMPEPPYKKKQKKSSQSSKPHRGRKASGSQEKN